MQNFKINEKFDSQGIINPEVTPITSFHHDDAMMETNNTTSQAASDIEALPTFYPLVKEDRKSVV